MNTEVQQKQIGRHVYACRKLPAGIGLPVLCRLMNLIGPSIKRVSSDEGTLYSIVGELLSNAQLGDQLDYFAKAFAPYSTVEEPGRSQELARIYDVHFAGNYFELMGWLVFCFEVNHGSFLAESGVSLRSVLSRVQAELSSRSPNKSVTPGPSGGSSSPAGSTRPTTVSRAAGQ